MRKLMCLVTMVTLGLTSYAQNDYRITGTMENAVEGDTVYLSMPVNQKLVSLDTAIVAKGQFVFTGVQDAAANRYISYKVEGNDRPLYAGFFLEKGNINIQMARVQGSEVVGGTPLNDAFQAFKTNMAQIRKKQDSLYESLKETTDEAQRAAIYEEGDAIQKDFMSNIETTIEQNITNALGVYLISMYYATFETEELGRLLDKLPAEYRSDATIVRLNEMVENAKATAVGQKFTDFEMKDANGNPVKLSDYVGKGNLVLVDFWASWCGPCRSAMPKIVESYAKYKDKNFEIVGVSLDNDEDKWKSGIEQLGMTWPQMSDLKGWKSVSATLYAISGIPHVLLIDSEGTIIARGLHGESLHEKLAELLD